MGFNSVFKGLKHENCIYEEITSRLYLRND